MHDFAAEMIRLALSSPASVTIIPLQDLLNLGREARMNVPGRAEGNWRWRATYSMLGDRKFEWLRNLTIQTHRDAAPLAGIRG